MRVELAMDPSWLPYPLDQLEEDASEAARERAAIIWLCDTGDQSWTELNLENVAGRWTLTAVGLADANTAFVLPQLDDDFATGRALTVIRRWDQPREQAELVVQALPPRQPLADVLVRVRLPAEPVLNQGFVAQDGLLRWKLAAEGAEDVRRQRSGEPRARGELAAGRPGMGGAVSGSFQRGLSCSRKSPNTRPRARRMG